MPLTPCRRLGCALLLLCGGLVIAAEPDLADYRTVDKAIPAKITKGNAAGVSRVPFLGLLLETDMQGRLTVADVAEDSPAQKAGIQRGDAIQQLDGREVKSDDLFQQVLRAKAPGEALRLKLIRQKQSIDVTATLTALSKSMTAGKPKGFLGVEVTKVKDGEGVAIEQIAPASPAERVKLKVGEVILKIDEIEIASPEKMHELIATKKPEDAVTLTLLLAEKRVQLKVTLDAESTTTTTGWNTRGGRYWTKPTYRIAIINVEFADQKHNPKVTAKAWEEAMFSKGVYKVTATGQAAFGSMHDYYWEQSHGQLKIEGKSFAHVEVSKNRAEYNTGSKNVFLNEAMNKLIAREGKEALKDFDGVFFIYAGGRFPNAPRGGLYWPHRSRFTNNGKSWDYFICSEGGRGGMGNISVFCHEFGHMLGLPDLYARPENPGSEGVGIWSAMANQAGSGRPQHFDAWCKEKLGWIKPTIIDPAVKQKLILAPIEDSPKECFKILVRPDGSEYLLLENRKKKGFDVSLPASGLLIWRVVANRPILEESHGVAGPSGPRIYLEDVPYPSEANNSFTPYTIPSSRSQFGGGPSIYITNIQRLADGRITFHVGYEYQ